MSEGEGEYYDVGVADWLDLRRHRCHRSHDEVEHKLPVARRVGDEAVEGSVKDDFGAVEKF